MTALDLIDRWPVPSVSAAVIAPGGIVASNGDLDRVQRLASISKPMAAWATLVAIEEGTIELDRPLGQAGCTVRHLLAHAGGYPFDGDEPIAKPESTRIYSNTGIEMVASAIAGAADMSFGEYLRAAVFEPLGMRSSELRGSPAHGVWSTLADTARFVVEAMSPRLVTAATAGEARRIQYPTLAGIVPGVGRYEQCPWGLGFEVRGDKQPHWTGSRNSPRTVGHFGGSGTMFWIDPDLDLALVALADRDFDAWRDEALAAWPALSDAVITEFADAGGAPS